jgi:ketosteroid isomerase-like protein
MMNENSDIVGRNRELIRRMYQAAAAGDMEAFFDSVADEVIVIRSDGHPAPGRWVGKEEMKRALGAKPHPASAQVSEIIADGPERVIVLVDEDFVDQDGKTISMPGITPNCIDSPDIGSRFRKHNSPSWPVRKLPSKGHRAGEGRGRPARCAPNWVQAISSVSGHTRA